ncbi:MAG: hypothetical protein WCO51_00295 [bacterium]|jgi:hypothetical protein
MNNLLPPAEERDWSLVAWHGVSFWVPNDWTFIPVNDPNETRIQVISPGQFTVQLRTQKSKAKADLHPVIDKYLKVIENQAKKKRQTFTGRVSDKPDGELEYNWRSDVKTHGVVRQCPTCMKIVIAEVTGGKNDAVLAMSKKILATLKDHQDDGWIPWAAFGLVTASPENYRLEKFQFTSGYLTMRFAKNGQSIVTDRWGLAYLALEECTLEQWFIRSGKWDSSEGTLEPATIHGHEGFYWTAQLKPLVKLREAITMLFKWKWPAFKVSGAGWHCPDTNRLFMVTWQHRGKIDFDELIERTVCHNSGQSA